MGSIGNRYLRFVAVFVLSVGGLVTSQLQAAEASIRHFTDKDYILEGDRQAFFIEVKNPTNEDLRIVKATISFSTNVDIRGLDRSCSQWRPSNATEIICTIPVLKSGASKQLSYSVVGSLDLRPGFEVAASGAHFDGTISVISQDQDSIGLADNNRFIEGPQLSIKVGRDILRDSDKDGVSDASELVQGTDPNNPRSSSNENAVIDVAVLVSEEADDYYNGLIGGRVEYLVAATNQLYKENKVGITLRLVALGRVDYTGSSMDQAFDDLTSNDSSAFSELEEIIDGVGADAVIFAHPFFRGSESEFCTLGLSNASAVQGDFYKERYKKRMLSIIDVSRGCIDVDSFSGPLAFNMGIASDRVVSPDGGTFSFSSGYTLDGSFATLLPSGAANATPFSASTTRLDRFSSPTRLCRGRPCGIDRFNLASGADAVFSLNATRHMISDLSPTRIPLKSVDNDLKNTIRQQNRGAIGVVQFPSVNSAEVGDWVSYQVEARNNSAKTLRHLEFRFRAGVEAEFVNTSDRQCAILSVQGSTLTSGQSGSLEGEGNIVCYVLALEPGQVAGFSYSAKIEDSNLLTETTYLRTALVNRFFIPGTGICTPITQSIDNTEGFADCDFIERTVNNEFSAQVLNPNADVSLLPQIDQSILTVPFIRLYDGGLISAQFRVIQGAKVALELVDVENLNPDLRPLSNSDYSSDGQLTLRDVQLIEGRTTLLLKLIESPDSLLFLQED